MAAASGMNLMNPDKYLSFYNGKRVLVAGGTGVIGIPTVERLIKAGAEVTVAAMDPPEFADLVLAEDVSYRKLDLTVLKDSLSATEGQEVVLNLVGIKGSTGIGETKVASYLVPMLWFQTNLMEAAFRNRVKRFLFVGSICSYPYSVKPKREETLWNGLPKQNDRIPGLAKRIGEVQGEAYLKEYGWDAVRIVRPSNVYGPFDDFDAATAQVVPSLIRRVLDGENPLKVWGDGSAIRDFIFSWDVAEWILKIIAMGPVCEPLNLGSGNGITIRELAETVVGVLAPDVSIVWDKTKPGGDPVRILSMEKTKSFLGKLPVTPLAEGIGRTANWYRENKEILSKKAERYYGR
jgi:GDP-L-fucose synthase